MCNITCQDCNRTTELCKSKCQPGWTGFNCQKECTPGSFGYNCSSTCGHCLNNSSCESANGTCLQGCEPGYKTPLCIEASNEVSMRGSFLPMIVAVVDILLIVLIIVVVLLIVRTKRKKLKEGKMNILSPERHEEFLDDTNHTDDIITRTSSCLKANNETKDKGRSFTKVFLSDKNERNKNYSIEEETVYGNDSFTQSIRVDILQEVIDRKMANGSRGFKSEYAALPYGEKHKCDVGKRPENILKNRFRTIFPYDHSRVVLSVTSDDPSDYINANYINGPNRVKEYIATEGPVENTVVEFWRMIWQENVTSIVMLTNLTEGEHAKCSYYWPNEKESLTVGAVLVDLAEEKKYAFFTKRKLSLSHKEFQNIRVITHYQYTAWPDYGSPEPLSLILFHQHVFTARNKKKAPTVVHCSAGVGRTGVFIALDALYQEGKKTGKVNVAEFVNRMRHNRVSMVQTYEQYMVIYLALNEIFKAPIKVKSVTEFCNTMEKMSSSNSAANTRFLHDEYQLLQKLCAPCKTIDHRTRHKNSKGRLENQLPLVCKHGQHLSAIFPKEDSYTNVVYIPSYTNARSFIVTHYPTQEGAVNFLRMLIDNGSNTVVCVDPLRDIDSMKSWLPVERSSKVMIPFILHCQSTSNKHSEGHSINIRDHQGDTEHTLAGYGPISRINPFGMPQNRLELLRLVSDVLDSKSDSPITVVSRDGTSLCGVFIAVHNVIQQLHIDSYVDVLTVVRQLRIHQPDLCSNIEEYEMVYRTVYDEVQTTTRQL
uniref:protein-tyrosine-phosphatase n=1 Tax=Crassostrea virginica TaxID=6565 RepID=A0A8B8C236_CRAVI|nr:receptor-type tyrosine-protein phosphatase epsilon-like isoform X5 [Crassostrea virginica]